MENQKTLAEKLAEIKESRSSVENLETPALWNPDVAAVLSLFLTPAFGAFVHMDNWNALGEPAKAANSKAWLIAGLLLVAFLPLLFTLENKVGVKGVVGLSLIIFLLCWYFICAQVQTKFIRARFGTVYLHNSWWRPIFFAFAVSITLIGASSIFFRAVGIEIEVG